MDDFPCISNTEPNFSWRGHIYLSMAAMFPLVPGKSFTRDHLTQHIPLSSQIGHEGAVFLSDPFVNTEWRAQGWQVECNCHLALRPGDIALQRAYILVWLKWERHSANCLQCMVENKSHLLPLTCILAFLFKNLVMEQKSPWRPALGRSAQRDGNSPWAAANTKQGGRGPHRNQSELPLKGGWNDR